jgi:hypothetical protein
MRLLLIDLYCGLGGWTEGFLAEGYQCIGFDIERHDYGSGGYPGQLVLQDVLTLHGSQFRDAACIVASPPCQLYSYMAMPWARAKRTAVEYRESPERIRGLNKLFDACFQIQREASEAAGRHIPMVVENVKGAQPWVGRARWHYGSFYLWGDVPALMPTIRGLKNSGGSWFGVAHNTESGHSQNPVTGEGLKTVGHINKRDGHPPTLHLTNQQESDGVKQHGSGAAWFDKALDQRRCEATAIKNGKDRIGAGENCSLQRRASSGSTSRKAASAQIAKIPFPLASYIARIYRPREMDRQ